MERSRIPFEHVNLRCMYAIPLDREADHVGQISMKHRGHNINTWDVSSPRTQVKINFGCVMSEEEEPISQLAVLWKLQGGNSGIWAALSKKISPVGIMEESLKTRGTV